jgi:hypothetical protein
MVNRAARGHVHGGFGAHAIGGEDWREITGKHTIRVLQKQQRIQRQKKSCQKTELLLVLSRSCPSHPRYGDL